MTIQFMKTEVFPHGMAPAAEQQALQIVELCGRTAYKSEDRITDDSARSFVLMLKKHGHLSVLEHSNLVLAVRPTAATSADTLEDCRTQLLAELQSRNAYHRISPLPGGGFAIAGNIRAWVETIPTLSSCAWLGDGLSRFYPSLFGPATGSPCPFEVSVLDEAEQLALLKADPGSDLPVFIFKMVCDRGITHEVVRHRVLSFTQESTRYVNYNNRGMALILPEELEPFFDARTGVLNATEPRVLDWIERAKLLFQWYQEDIARGLKPQIARDILPNLLKSEIFVSGRWSGWTHFVKLRDSSQAHPRIRLIAQQVRRHFDSLGLGI